MGRSRAAAALALVPLTAMSLVACDNLLGLGDFQRVACQDTCPDSGITDSGNTLSDVASDSDDEHVPPFDGAVAATDGAWAAWPMPNPDGGADAGWPNVVTYEKRDGGVVHDNVTGLDWTIATFAATDAAAQAAGDCASIGFRLPTRIELASLIDFTRPSPTIDPVFAGAPGGPYWTSSATPNDGGLWVVDFDDGTVAQRTFSATRAVRCVRRATP